MTAPLAALAAGVMAAGWSCLRRQGLTGEALALAVLGAGAMLAGLAGLAL